MAATKIDYEPSERERVVLILLHSLMVACNKTEITIAKETYTKLSKNFTTGLQLFWNDDVCSVKIVSDEELKKEIDKDLHG